MRVQIGVTSTVRLRAGQDTGLRRNAGASRFAYNWGVHRFRVQREEQKKNPATRMLYSPFAFIDAFGAWKKSAAAGFSEVNGVGLTWRTEVSAQVMEESAADCGRAVEAFLVNLRDRKLKKTKHYVGPPHFKSRSHDKLSFRLRNKDGRRF